MDEETGEYILKTDINQKNLLVIRLQMESLISVREGKELLANEFMRLATEAENCLV